MASRDRLAIYWKVGLCALVVGVVFHRVAPTFTDPDLWGHVRFGLDLAGKGLTLKDPYSYTSDRVWINHEWLAELIFAWAYRWAGPSGLVLLKVAVSTLIFGALYWHLCRFGFGVFRGGMMVLIALFPASTGLQAVRPHLFTYLGFLLVLMIIKETDEGRSRWIWAVPPLMLIWANMHGGFLAGLGILGIWWIALVLRFVCDRGSPSLPVKPWAPFAAIAMAGLATLVNPYGFHLLTFLARTATVPRPDIGEWQPVAIVSRLGVAYLVIVGLSLYAWSNTRLRRSVPLIVLFVVIAILPLVALRHLPLFALAFGVLIGDHLSDALARRWPEDRLGGPDDAWRRPFLAASAVACVALVGTGIRDLSEIRVDPTLPVPVESVSLLEESGVEGNLALFFDWGEYAIWHLGPKIKVSIDGRRETVYSGAVLLENLNFLYGRNQWDALLDERPTDLVLVGRRQAAFNLMKLKPGWRRVWEDDISGLFAREGSELAAKLTETPAPEPISGPSVFP